MGWSNTPEGAVRYKTARLTVAPAGRLKGTSIKRLARVVGYSGGTAAPSRFGPVAAVYRFETEDEAIRLANRTEYGLAAYVYSQDLKRAMRVAGAIETGMVGINRGLMSDPAAPFGGVKQSGLGREKSRHALDEYMEYKTIYLGL